MTTLTDMMARSSFRIILPAVVLAAAALVAACDATPSDDPRNDREMINRPAHSPSAVAADSLSGKGARKNPIDSAMLAPPPPLAAAPAAIASDTIPLQAPGGAPARYGLKSGRIVQRYTGNSRGERRILFDDYGMRERREEVTEPYPEGTNGRLSNVIMITTNDEQSYADVRTKHGYRTSNEGLKRYLAMGALKTMSLGALIMSQSGAERLADTVIAGYHCRVLRKKVNGMTITDWLWRGIVIREHVVSPQDKVEYTIEPIEITPNVAVPAESFSYPSDFVMSPYTPRQ
jgi:hypothetical protein